MLARLPILRHVYSYNALDSCFILLKEAFGHVHMERYRKVPVRQVILHVKNRRRDRFSDKDNFCISPCVNHVISDDLLST